ncbi:MAG: TonB-dependent receptor [Bacteroidetes bacterium]|nr:TonB-dependent receptor [Bacteroidota bacterium]
MHRKIFYFLLFLALCPALLNAGTRGRIKGKVVDSQTGEGLIGANVVIVGTTMGANTDANGEFLLQNVEPGVYSLRASYVGYKAITLTDVRVNADLTAYVSISLPSEDIQVGTVTIVAQKPLIQKDNTNAVRITTSDDIAALPIRSVTNIIGLTAGVIVQNNIIFIRGGRQDEVGYYLEGVTTKDPIYNRNAVTVGQDAIEEIQVQAGGYTAEFGGANSGIVREQLKSGGQNLKASFEWITDNIGFKSKANAFDGKKTLGAYWWGYSETSGVLSGPIFGDRGKFFFNLDYRYNRDPNPQPWPGINLGTIIDQVVTKDTLKDFNYPAGPLRGAAQQVYNYTGTFNYDLNPVLLRVTGTLASLNGDAGGGNPGGNSALSSYLNTRVGQFTQTNASFTVKLTHVINPNMFYEITGGYSLQKGETYDRALGSDYWSYGDSVANAATGWTIPRDPRDITINNNAYFGRYIPGKALVVDNFRFAMDGAVPVNYSKYDSRWWSINAALSINLGKYHSIKIGGEYNQYTLRNWSGINTINLAKTLNDRISTQTNPDIVAEKMDILRGQGVNNYGYDVLGNTYDGGGFDAPHKPVFAAAYIQDKIEFEDLILNLGLRFDYFDINNLVFKDPTMPELAISRANTLLNPDGYVKAAPFSSVSPRIGFSFPVTTTSMFHAQYGKFVQQPRLGDIYQGYYSFAQRIRGAGNYYQTVTGPNLRPERTTQYEIGFTQQVTDFLSFDITGFYRDISDLVQYTRQPTPSNYFGPEYYIYSNRDFGTTKGVEISLNMRRYSRLQVRANISFQSAEGTNSTPNTSSGLVFQPVANTIYEPKVVAPLINNKPISGNLSVDYRWGKDDGPKVLQNFGISTILTFNSGHPFTLGTGNLNAESDARNRTPLEAINSSLTPSVFQVDLRVDKTFSIMDRLNLNVYVYVINLFDTQNIVNVFLKTGGATDDGVLSNPDLGKRLIQTYGQDYANLYRALNINYQQGYGSSTGLGGNDLMFGPPRQIRLGVRLEY